MHRSDACMCFFTYFIYSIHLNHFGNRKSDVYLQQVFLVNCPGTCKHVNSFISNTISMLMWELFLPSDWQLCRLGLPFSRFDHSSRTGCRLETRQRTNVCLFKKLFIFSFTVFVFTTLDPFTYCHCCAWFNCCDIWHHLLVKATLNTNKTVQIQFDWTIFLADIRRKWVKTTSEFALVYIAITQFYVTVCWSNHN